ncbi:MAG: 7-cyano-7-deazaguanine synthase QueC [Myxococcota bacterium]
MKRAVVLLSGGLDSATTAAVALDQGFTLSALSFDYGQRHRRELEAARRVVDHLAIADHRVVRIGLDAFGGSALTDDSIDVPTLGPGGSIPATYVPARNTIFLAVALGLAEVLGAFDIFFGANAIDYSGYPDCRPEFVSAFEELARLGTKAGVEGQGPFRIHAPLIHDTKADIIRRAQTLGLDLGLTFSCYAPTSRGPCGVCDSCRLRAKGFAEAHLVDPAS